MDFAVGSVGRRESRGDDDDAMLNEMFADDARVRPHYVPYARWLESMPGRRIAEKRAEADALFHRAGITFAVDGAEEGTERLIPFDIVPRIIPAEEWAMLQNGLRQRVSALNAFCHDVYHGQEILRAGRIPPDQVFCNGQYRPEMQGIDVPMDVFSKASDPAHWKRFDVLGARRWFFKVAHQPEMVTQWY